MARVAIHTKHRTSLRDAIGVVKLAPGTAALVDEERLPALLKGGNAHGQRLMDAGFVWTSTVDAVAPPAEPEPEPEVITVSVDGAAPRKRSKRARASE